MKIMEVFELHAECYEAEARAMPHGGNTPFGFDDLRYVASVLAPAPNVNGRTPAPVAHETQDEPPARHALLRGTRRSFPGRSSAATEG